MSCLRSFQAVNRFVTGRCVAVISCILLPAGAPAWAQSAQTPHAPVIENLVVTGSRSGPQSSAETLAPVHVIGGHTLMHQADVDLPDLLRTVAPSFNVNTQPISDAGTIVRPANLRGLAPDQALVLVNGKRRHRSAVISWLSSSVSSGSQGPDLAAVPAIALRQVEVLGDGASAQYGSDAIAGVINLLLREDAAGAAVSARYGSYYQGDGDQYTIAANLGLPLTARGFLNLSAEFSGQDPTVRSVQRDDAAALIQAGNTAVADPVQIWGSPQVDDNLKLWSNFAAVLDGGVELYGHAGWLSKHVDGGFNYRNPHTRSGVYSNDAGQTLLVADALDAEDGVPDGSANCPLVTVRNNVADPAALAAIQANPNCFTFLDLFPGGFTPRFGGDLEDYSALLGLRGKWHSGLRWDLSAGLGSNRVDYFIYDTLNGSLGPASPTSFDPGYNRQQELNLNLDLAYAVSDRLHLAAGLEWREEEYTIGLGGLPSYRIGPYAAQGFSSASNGFPGFSPLAAGRWRRENTAAYADVEMNLQAGWTLGLAARHEQYPDYGGHTTFKLASRYQLTPVMALRGAYGTAFRAPTPGQANAFNVSAQWNFERSDLVNNGTIPPTNPVAQLRGGRPLKLEKSRNFTLGAVFALPRARLSVDYFSIKLRDRITLSELFTLLPEEVSALLESGVTSAGNLQNFRFFVNDYDTHTQGVDLLATLSAENWGGHTTWSLGMNATFTEVESYSGVALTDASVRDLEDSLPGVRGYLSVDHMTGAWQWLARVNYYAGWYDPDQARSYGGEFQLDLEGQYQFSNHLRLTVGAQNALNGYPDENPNARSTVGDRYSEIAPLGFNGGLWYLRLMYEY